MKRSSMANALRLWNHTRTLTLRSSTVPRETATNYFGVTADWANVGAKRFYSPEPAKRFYAEVTVQPSASSGDGQGPKSFEIHLDNKKMKTPVGKQNFTVQNETIAQAIATEWASQKRHVLQAQMHLTALANTVQDNPLRKTKEDVLTAIMNSLSLDTLLFRSPDTPKLVERHEKEWDPIIAWFEQEYNVTLPIFEASIVPTGFIPKETVKNLLAALNRLNIESLHGLYFGVGSVQSLILPLAVFNQRLTVEEAVQISRLELRYQIEHWGNVEWAHDLELYDSLARLSAAMIFMYTHSKRPFAQLSS